MQQSDRVHTEHHVVLSRLVQRNCHRQQQEGGGDVSVAAKHFYGNLKVVGAARPADIALAPEIIKESKSGLADKFRLSTLQVLSTAEISKGARVWPKRVNPPRVLR